MKIKDRRIYRAALFFMAIFCSGVLFFAALAKIIYPASSLALTGVWLGIGEVCLAAALLVYYPYPLIWMVVGSVFSAWGGYACFWLIQGLPCGCFGTIVDIDPSVALMFDILFWTVSCAVLKVENYYKYLKIYFVYSFALFVFGGFFGFIIKNFIEL